MKRVVRSLLLFFCTTLFMLSASLCVCVVRVYADVVSTYLPVSGCFVMYSGSTGDKWSYTTNSVRSLILTNLTSSGGGEYTIYFVSTSSFEYSDSTSQASCPATHSGYVYTVNINGTDYYVGQIGLYFSNAPTTNIPIVYKDSSVTNNMSRERAIYYTYGDGAIDPVEPVSYGFVDVKGYQTNVAGQGQASINNVDVISWDSAIDTLGNDISDGNVRIRLIPGEYTGETKNSLVSKLYTDFILDIVHATDGNVFPVTNGSASFKWSDVINTLNLPFISVYSLINENDAWIKRGWIYEIRLEIDDYIGEWQPIYASTSSGVENDLQIVNTTIITQQTISAIQSINSINGTTNIWIINGQPVDPNPEQTNPESDDEKPWWVYLLEMINNTLGVQNEYINEGTDESIEVVNNFEDDHTELNTTVNNYDDIENNLVLDMNNNLEQIEVDSDLIENNSFISSARWIAEQYTRITTDNPIGSILKFSLILGFVMIFLGRFK